MAVTCYLYYNSLSDYFRRNVLLGDGLVHIQQRFIGGSKLLLALWFVVPECHYLRLTCQIFFFPSPYWNRLRMMFLFVFGSREGQGAVETQQVH